MRTLYVLLVCALLCAPLAAQSPDRWRGLVLGETTPEQAIATLGQPKESKPDKIRIQKIGDWLSKDIKQELPHLRWEEIAGMKSVDAYFLNGKLAALQLIIKADVRASALESIYGVEFSHLISNAGRVMAGPGAYQRDRGKTYSNQEEVAYHVGAKAERAFLVAWVDVGFGEGLKRAYGAGTDSDRPGKVRLLQMYARSLENRDGADVLSGDSPLSSQPVAKPATANPAPVPSAPKPTPTPKACYSNGYKVPCP